MLQDSELREIQFQVRKEHHNKVKHSNFSFNVDDNVILRNDRNKLHGREMYKVVGVNEQEDKTWLKLQKTESQF